jgi:hypothetical protein
LESAASIRVCRRFKANRQLNREQTALITNERTKYRSLGVGYATSLSVQQDMAISNLLSETVG